MTTNWYTAVVHQHDGAYWVTMPDLLGVNVADEDLQKALDLTAEIAADYIADLANDGHPMPKPGSVPEIEPEPGVKEFCRAMIPVAMPGGRAIKISMTIDEGLLARADQVAERVGETRSGFFAVAVQQRIRSLASDDVTVERIERALRGVDLAKLVTTELQK